MGSFKHVVGHIIIGPNVEHVRLLDCYLFCWRDPEDPYEKEIFELLLFVSADLAHVANLSTKHLVHKGGILHKQLCIQCVSVQA